MSRKFPLVRLKQFVSNPRYLFFWLCRFFIYKKSSYQFIEKFNSITQLSDEQTLNDIIENNKSIIRFGDGEFGLLSGAGIYPPDSDWSQQYSRELKKTLERQLQSKNDDILIAFPPLAHIRYQEGDTPALDVIPSMHTELRMYLWKHLNHDSVYGDWSVFMPQHHKNINWKKIAGYLSKKTVVIVTGDIERLKEVSLGRKTLFIECGKHNAFERRVEIIQSVDELIARESLNSKETIFWISLSCTAGVVVEHLSERGFVAWDTGHIFRFAENEIRRELGSVKI
jgi:hypothetical protein